MRSVSVTVAVLMTSLAAAGALACFFAASHYQNEGNWLLERGNAQAEEYARSFDSAVAETQMATLDQRRETLQKAHAWQRLQILLIVLTVIGTFCSYVLYLFGRLREQLVEASESLDTLHGPAVETARRAISNAHG
jgi:hypothetical protein